MQKKIERQKMKEEQVDVDAIVASLVGAIPDTGKNLEEYRNERLIKRVSNKSMVSRGNRIVAAVK